MFDDALVETFDASDVAMVKEFEQILSKHVSKEEPKVGAEFESLLENMAFIGEPAAESYTSDRAGANLESGLTDAAAQVGLQDVTAKPYKTPADFIPQDAQFGAGDPQAGAAEIMDSTKSSAVSKDVEREVLVDKPPTTLNQITSHEAHKTHDVVKTDGRLPARAQATS